MLAGCSSSTSFARLTLLDPVAEGGSDELEICAGVHVDDVGQTSVHDSASAVLDMALQHGVGFARVAQCKGMPTLGKSIIIASSSR